MTDFRTIAYGQLATELAAELAGEEVNSDAVQEFLEARGIDYDHVDVGEIEWRVERMQEPETDQG